MKHLKSTLLLCLMLLCTMFISDPAQAASAKPAQVKKLTATAAESNVTLKWKSVSNATGYTIYRLDTTTNTLVRVARTRSTTYKVKKLTNSVTYTYCVAAYRLSSGKTCEGKTSSYVQATPLVKKPGVTSLSIKSCNNQKVSFKWSKISGATGYEIFQKSASTNKYVSIGTTKGTSVTVKNLTNGKNYQFKVRAYRTVGGVTRYGNLSASITAKPMKVSSAVSSMPTMKYKATVINTVNAPLVSNSSKSVRVSAGTSVTITYVTYSRCKVLLSSNQEVYINRSNLNIINCIYSSSRDLSKTVKQDFVNSRGYKSSTNYLIWISLYKQRLYIYKGSQCNWTIYKSFKCSTGKATTSTPKGVYTLWKKAPIFEFDEYSYARYASYFSGNAIHSWVMLYTGGKYNDGVLGQPSSHGCVRLGDSQSLFVYNKIPMGTTIVIY